MQPLLNLKAFLAVLLLLIVSGSILAAYFRNYSAEAPAHEHGEKGANHGAAMDQGGMKGMEPSEGHATPDHHNISK